MTVSADLAKDRVRTATTGLVNLREQGRWLGGSHRYDGGERLVTGWHFHDVHEIEYACRGLVEVRTETAHYLLPPHQAAWIPAGLASPAPDAVKLTAIQSFGKANFRNSAS